MNRIVISKAISLCFGLILATALATAQEMTTVVDFVPGENIPLTVTFDRAVKPASLGCYFELVGEPIPNQTNFGRSFQCDGSFAKLSDAEYHLTAPVPEGGATGTYKLLRISLLLEGVWKNYQATTDFKPVTVSVRNPKDVKFPKIEDVVVPKK